MSGKILVTSTSGSDDAAIQELAAELAKEGFDAVIGTDTVEALKALVILIHDAQSCDQNVLAIIQRAYGVPGVEVVGVWVPGQHMDRRPGWAEDADCIVIWDIDKICRAIEGDCQEGHEQPDGEPFPIQTPTTIKDCSKS